MEALDYISLSPQETQKLLAAGNGNAALLLLYIRATGDTRLLRASEQLHMSVQDVGWAESLLKQLGLLDVTAPATRFEKSRAPVYTGEDLTAYAARDNNFKQLQGEFSRQLGRVLSSEELKTLLSIRDYLKLPPEVVYMALNYCLQRNERYNQLNGTDRTVTMRTIEKECYAWANQGITTFALASEYMGRSIEQLRPESQIKKLIQPDRPLTDTQKKYIQTWLGWGFPLESVKLAIERTSLKQPARFWPYLNRILQSWHEKGLHTPEEIQAGDKPAAQNGRNTPADNGFTPGASELGAIANLARLRDQMKEGK